MMVSKQLDNEEILLPEYLQQNTQNALTKLVIVSSADELLQYLKQTKDPILWLDLELCSQNDVKDASGYDNNKNKPACQLLKGAMVIDNYCCMFDKEQFISWHTAIIKLMNQSHSLGGHNIIDFDLPELVKLFESLNNITIDERMLNAWQQKSYDTLRLSSLLFPHQPSHALSKLYKANTQNNHPIFDCIESRLIFERCKVAWAHLSNVWQSLFYQLLPAIKPLNHFKYDFFEVADNPLNWQELFSDLPVGDKTALMDFLNQKIKTAQNWKNLGAACFVSWLRFFDKPSARRPIWIMKHDVFQTGFVQAEQLFWQNDTQNEQKLNDWLDTECQAFFGYNLRDGQKNIVKNIFQDQNMTLGILPTGGGKSLSFQLPALIMSKYHRDLTVVISPLQALIEDQVIDLKLKLEKSRFSDYKTRIGYLTANQTPEIQNEVLTAVWLGQVDILYLSPERLGATCIKKLLKHRPPAFWVLDEAHTLSQWGIDFRPDFLRIAEHIMACYGIQLKDTQSNIQADLYQTDLLEQLEHPIDFTPPKIALVTATASKKIRDDLKKELTDKLIPLVGVTKDLVQCGVSLDDFQVWRDNILLSFLEVPKDRYDKKTQTYTPHYRYTEILKIILKRKLEYQIQCIEANKENKGVALVYVRNRKLCEAYASDFADKELKAACYHSKLSKSQKQNVLSQFKNHELDVVVCTNAFGMGIDKEGIHTVIHSGVPNNLESYVQEIGRGARKEGEVAHAYLLWSEEDIELLFSQDKKSRIPNEKTLHDCWEVVKTATTKPPKECWINAHSLSPILQIDEPEELNTQIRIVLLALERHGLLKEKERQPAYISIKLLKKPDNEFGREFVLIYQKLVELGEQFEKSNQAQSHYYLPDLAQVLGYSIKDLLKKIGKMVEFGSIEWQIYLAIKSKYTQVYQKTLFNRAIRACYAIQQCITEQNLEGQESIDDNIAYDGYTSIHDGALLNWMKKNQINLKPKEIFAVLRALNVLFARQNRYQWQIEPTHEVKNRLKQEDKTHSWTSWLEIAEENHRNLEELFEYLQSHMPDKKGALEYFDLHDLALTLQLSCHDTLLRLQMLQNLNIIELSCLDGSNELVFFVEKGTKTKLHSDVAYQYLKEHYDERCQKIHVLYHWLKENNPDIKRQMLEDYFRYGMQKIVQKYLPEDVDSTKPYLKNYRQLILPSWLSNTQRSIITNTSRASLVLAGPGSGKTTVVVHRVAYLLMQENIDPQKILILAYNRMAVYELRARLKKLVDKHANGVTITTFHGLARSIIDRNENDVSQEELAPIINHLKDGNKTHNNKLMSELEDAARYIWLIDEAIRTLKEDPKFFQYIMVDEFQDVDEKQYTMIGMLADLKMVDDEEQHNENTQKLDKITANKDNYEQQGYLMVVGDDDQNLYEWRGASVRFIQEFEKNYHITDSQKFYLLENYRSSCDIVELANAFIEQSIPQKNRLKTPEHAVIAKGDNPNMGIRFGGFEQPKGIDMAYWLSCDIAQKLKNMTETGEKQSIAILAPRWEIFDAIQHYLQIEGIESQRFNEQENCLLPANSVIGRALQSYIISLTDEKAREFLDDLNQSGVIKVLEAWRKKYNFNPLDNAWQAILHNVSKVSLLNLDNLLTAIKTAEYDNDKAVSLITYYSAKGMEFDHVYVVDDRNYFADNLGDFRSLYVALTRAKHSLTILQNKEQYNRVLCDLLYKNKMGEIMQINLVEKPKFLQFNRYLTLKEIHLTPSELTKDDDARAFIPQTFAKDWGCNTADLSQVFKNDHGQGFYSKKNRLLVKFSNYFKKEPYAADVKILSFTTTYYFQRELSYYQQVGYNGNEREHCLIIPFVTIIKPLNR